MSAILEATTLQQRAAAIDWWHSGIELGGGVVTVGRTDPQRTLLPYLNLPADLTGKRVLDICAWDGYMAFECERRGADVMAVDSYAWDKPDVMASWHRTGKDGFDLAHTVLHSMVEDVHCHVLDLDARQLGQFDIVLFLGVLYHMRHPLLALERVAPLVRMNGGTLLVESHTDMMNVNAPAMRFYPGAEANNDPTNWWGPNVACIVAMLRSAGFGSVEVLHNGPRAVVRAGLI